MENQTKSPVNIQQHVNILGWLFIILDLVFIVAAIFAFFLITGIGALQGGEYFQYVSRVTATVVAIALTIISIPGLIVGIGILKRKSWARLIAIILGVINLFNFPIGTILGVYTFWVLLNPESSALFE
ncbi:MAG: hypothetical protein GF401_09080 [Chitinivibrionales bacterium]|nr:hypothetical protein [Chitinivibrionales bacterium]